MFLSRPPRSSRPFFTLGLSALPYPCFPLGLRALPRPCFPLGLRALPRPCFPPGLPVLPPLTCALQSMELVEQPRGDIVHRHLCLAALRVFTVRAATVQRCLMHNEPHTSQPPIPQTNSFQNDQWSWPRAKEPMSQYFWKHSATNHMASNWMPLIAIMTHSVLSIGFPQVTTSFLAKWNDSILHMFTHLTDETLGCFQPKHEAPVAFQLRRCKKRNYRCTQDSSFRTQY
jgi:hypothetical protein